MATEFSKHFCSMSDIKLYIYKLYISVKFYIPLKKHVFILNGKAYFTGKNVANVSYKPAGDD